MTPTEADFQSRLDADPGDQVTRLALSDWLAEQGDPRAEGYKVLALMNRVPSGMAGVWMWFTAHRTIYWDLASALPADWFIESRFWLHHHTRQQAEDAAAAGWLKVLTDTRRRILKLVEG